MDGQPTGNNQEENPRGRKLIKGLVVPPPRLCMGIKTLKSLKRQEGKSRRRVSAASCEDENFKERPRAYERSRVEITHGGIQRKLSVKRLIKTCRRYEKRLDAVSMVSFWILNTLKGTKPHERPKSLVASRANDGDSMKGQRP